MSSQAAGRRPRHGKLACRLGPRNCLPCMSPGQAARRQSGCCSGAVARHCTSPPYVSRSEKKRHMRSRGEHITGELQQMLGINRQQVQ